MLFMKFPVAPTQAFMVLADATVVEASSAAVEQLLVHVRNVRGFIDAVEACASHRLRTLSDQGDLAGSVVDAHVAVGGVSTREARTKERRADMCGRAPSFGDALATGGISSSHVDALANITSKLDDHIVGKLLDFEQDLLVDAKRLPPNQFSKTCRALVAVLEHDEGVSRAEQQRKQTRLTRRIDSDGMHHLAGVFHPEMGARIWNSIDHALKQLATGKTPSQLSHPRTNRHPHRRPKQPRCRSTRQPRQPQRQH